jgi:hypothetical protein
MLLTTSIQYSGDDLQKIVKTDASHGGTGRAKAILTVSFDELTDNRILSHQID